MALLKEDGSLDIERINALPIEELMKLTEAEFRASIKHAINEPMSENERQTFANIHTYNSWGAYRTDFLFHSQNLRGTASVVVFAFGGSYHVDAPKVTLRGHIIFNGEHLYGSIMVDMTTHEVTYKHKRESPRYTLTIDPSKKGIWDSLIHQISSMRNAYST